MSHSIDLCDVTLGYGRHPAVHHLNGRIEAGALLAVVGPNGAGKSTLLKGLMGQLKPLDGRITLNGFGVRDIAYLPQLADIDRSFPLPVYDFVAMGLWRQVGLFKRIGAGERGRIEAAIASVGLEGFETRTLGSLSGGQVQRALFARLLLQDARVILLDEPFNAIDAKTAADLLDLIGRWHAEARTVIAVMHDLETVRRRFPQSWLLARELLAAGPTDEVLRAENLLRARRMVEAFDPFAAACDRGAA
ncbi:MAG: ABC transporter ATP-binding protein [Hyphomicrobiaceae bacterium]|nr:ABC transporter ATP-binding protein [Hyphomicrobiaceae bacterium]